MSYAAPLFSCLARPPARACSRIRGGRGNPVPSHLPHPGRGEGGDNPFNLHAFCDEPRTTGLNPLLSIAGELGQRRHSRITDARARAPKHDNDRCRRRGQLEMLLSLHLTAAVQQETRQRGCWLPLGRGVSSTVR